MMVKDQALERQETKEAAVYRYEVTTAKMIDVGEDMEYTTYGIEAYDDRGTVVAEYQDISTSESFVRAIAQKCNDTQTDVLHLRDIILDEIG